MYTYEQIIGTDTQLIMAAGAPLPTDPLLGDTVPYIIGMEDPPPFPQRPYYLANPINFVPNAGCQNKRQMFGTRCGRLAGPQQIAGTPVTVTLTRCDCLPWRYRSRHRQPPQLEHNQGAICSRCNEDSMRQFAARHCALFGQIEPSTNQATGGNAVNSISIRSTVNQWNKAPYVEHFKEMCQILHQMYEQALRTLPSRPHGLCMHCYPLPKTTSLPSMSHGHAYEA